MSMREVQLLGYHTAKCPHCNKIIYIPEYRQQPGTSEDEIKYRNELKKRFEKGGER